MSVRESRTALLSRGAGLSWSRSRRRRRRRGLLLLRRARRARLSRVARDSSCAWAAFVSRASNAVTAGACAWNSSRADVASNSRSVRSRTTATTARRFLCPNSGGRARSSCAPASWTWSCSASNCSRRASWSAYGGVSTIPCSQIQKKLVFESVGCRLVSGGDIYRLGCSQEPQEHVLHRWNLSKVTNRSLETLP